MTCSNCGKDIPSTAKFCPGCGSAIVPEDDVNTNITEVQEPCLDRVDNPVEIMSVSSENQNGQPEGNEKQPFVWKDQHTYIAIGVGLILAVIIGLAIRTSKNNSMNDNYVATSQENDEVNKYEDENTDFATDTTQEYLYNEPESDSDMIEEDEIQEIDVEEEVLGIREEYNDIVDAIQSDNYNKIADNSISAYFEDNTIRAIRIPQGAVGNYYAESFYYDEYGNLIFAYYEADDANRLYFKNSKLIRWRYSVNANDAQNAENYDLDDSSQYADWENVVLNDSYYYIQLMSNSENWEQEDYILSESNSRYLNISELNGLSAEECRLARNELYARHGRKFDDEELRAYFESKEWYIGTIEPSDFTEDMLNDYEIYNRDMIVEYEKEQGYR